MEETTKKITRDEVELVPPCMWASLLRRTAEAKDGDKVTFAGRTLVTHSAYCAGVRCNWCCFDYVDDLCDFVSCLPEERSDNLFAWFTIEPSGKEVSNE